MAFWKRRKRPVQVVEPADTGQVQKSKKAVKRLSSSFGAVGFSIPRDAYAPRHCAIDTGSRSAIRTATRTCETGSLW